MNRSVLVTGTSSGLGRDMAIRLAERGFDVYASMRDLSRRENLDAEAARRNVHLKVLQLDVTDPASIQRAVGQVVRESGGIYGLVNNAGVTLGGYFEDQLDAEVRHVLEVNLFGTMAMTRAVLPHMRAAGRGRIVIISSFCGRIGSIAASSYAASKFAVEGFGESLAAEMAPFGIGVSLVAPGAVKTELLTENRITAQSARDPSSPYYLWFRAAEQLFDRVAATAPTRSVDVSDAVCKALSAPRPVLHHVIGWRANLLVKMRRYLPEPWFERLYFGLTNRQLTRRVPATQETP